MKRFPMASKVVGVGRRIAYWSLGAATDGRALRALEGVSPPHGKEIARAVCQLRGRLPEEEFQVIEKIEEARRRLLRRTGMLVSGPLPPGPNDEGVSIKAACEVSKPPRPALLLYLLVRAFAPRVVIELGTNVGISSAYLAAALAMNGKGRLVTLEASAHRLRLAKEVHESVGLDNVTYVKGFFSETLRGALAEAGTVDFAFIDGHHQYQPTLDYFDEVSARATPDATYVFDDIRWSSPMTRAWQVIQKDPRIGLSVDLHSMGICVGARDATVERYTSPPVYSALF